MLQIAGEEGWLRRGDLTGGGDQGLYSKEAGHHNCKPLPHPQNQVQLWDPVLPSQAAHALFYPCPSKANLVSRPVSAWERGKGRGTKSISGTAMSR